jgi:pimeloyl-ACP methyl ester carboxylesterase
MTTPSISVNDTTIAYDAKGEGPPIVLVHGLTESRRMWDPLRTSLAIDHKVVTLDLPGHGESQWTQSYDTATFVNVVAAVVEETALVRPLLIGHSMGGTVVTNSVKTVSCRGVINVDQKLNFAQSRSAVASFEPYLRGDEATLQRAMRDAFSPLTAPLRDKERRRIENLRLARRDVVKAIWEPLFEWSVADLEAFSQDVTAGVSVPYLSLHGTDPGDDYATWLADRIPQAEIEIWPATGHYPHLAEPERFLTRVHTFEDRITEKEGEGEDA